MLVSSRSLCAQSHVLSLCQLSGPSGLSGRCGLRAAKYVTAARKAAVPVRSQRSVQDKTQKQHELLPFRLPHGQRWEGSPTQREGFCPSEQVTPASGGKPLLGELRIRDTSCFSQGTRLQTSSSSDHAPHPGPSSRWPYTHQWARKSARSSKTLLVMSIFSQAS